MRFRSVLPYVLVLVDTSGAMGASTGSGTNDCGYPRTRANDVKCALREVVASTGEVAFGLVRFHVRACDTSTRPTGCVTSGGLGEHGDCVAPCPPDACDDTCWPEPTEDATDDATLRERHHDAADVVVTPADETAAEVLRWADGRCAFPLDPELDVASPRPLAGALGTVRRYLAGDLATETVRHPAQPSPFADDPHATCRPYRVVVVASGGDTCGGDPAARAAELRDVPYAGARHDVRTSVIAYDVDSADAAASLETLAAAGGTHAPGGTRAFRASGAAELRAAFAWVVSDVLPVEVCNGRDDDCDGAIDDGFTRYCDRDGRLGAPTSESTSCADPGDDCDGSDDNCFAGISDEPRNRCGTCGEIEEICFNWLDDDCDGIVDDPDVCGEPCRASPELCNGLDDDCDGCVDGSRASSSSSCRSLERPCGGAPVGVCRPGIERCVDGAWVGCSGVAPTIETCDARDDDCDGVVDAFVERCGFSDVGACTFGVRACTAGAWTDCRGARGPFEERCNGLDDDCDGVADDGVAPGAPCGGSGGSGCGAMRMQCIAGAMRCARVECADPRDAGARDAAVLDAAVCPDDGCVAGLRDATTPSVDGARDATTTVGAWRARGGCACRVAEGSCTPGGGALPGVLVVLAIGASLLRRRSVRARCDCDRRPRHPPSSDWVSWPRGAEE
ncbi:MAG: VWA domain-containing protein [Deltaproteobacteria bacterium]|nr:VWA domain-containing protein [Deltaproteobacteria bacterium]